MFLIFTFQIHAVLWKFHPVFDNKHLSRGKGMEGSDIINILLCININLWVYFHLWQWQIIIVVHFSFHSHGSINAFQKIWRAITKKKTRPSYHIDHFVDCAWIYSWTEKADNKFANNKQKIIAFKNIKCSSKKLPKFANNKGPHKIIKIKYKWNLWFENIRNMTIKFRHNT